MFEGGSFESESDSVCEERKSETSGSNESDENIAFENLTDVRLNNWTLEEEEKQHHNNSQSMHKPSLISIWTLWKQVSLNYERKEIVKNVLKGLSQEQMQEVWNNALDAFLDHALEQNQT